METQKLAGHEESSHTGDEFATKSVKELEWVHFIVEKHCVVGTSVVEVVGGEFDVVEKVNNNDETIIAG